MSKLCIGFEVHQPFRLDRAFSGRNGGINDPESLYFSPLNKEILERVADNCYIPATGIVLDALDRGFKCAFSISGTALEQLERWRPDALDLFGQVAAHRNAEMLAQTYYHSIASLFDTGEFERQVELHRDAMRSFFGVEPKVMENTEFIFNNGIARSAAKMGFEAVYAEGVERVLGWRSPDYVYSCSGVKLLLRNYRLSDDIAFRFNNRDWDQYPLMADKFAAWVAASRGDCANVFIDYETFGEHHRADSGILEFLRWLPRELARSGVEPVTPSEAARTRPRGELDIGETISWADVEKDASAWLGNAIQRSALRALERARAYSPDKKIWRYLQTSDHFYYMASKFGACGDVHNYFSLDPSKPHDSFATYMKVVSHYERACARKMKKRHAAMELRAVPPEEAFDFYTPGGYTGLTAYGLEDLCELLGRVPEGSVELHLANKDISRWVKDVLGDGELAEAVAACNLRPELLEVVNQKRDELREGFGRYQE